MAVGEDDHGPTSLLLYCMGSQRVRAHVVDALMMRIQLFKRQGSRVGVLAVSAERTCGCLGLVSSEFRALGLNMHRQTKQTEDLENLTLVAKASWGGYVQPSVASRNWAESERANGAVCYYVFAKNDGTNNRAVTLNQYCATFLVWIYSSSTFREKPRHHRGWRLDWNSGVSTCDGKTQKSGIRCAELAKDLHVM